jgi:hypothetical protein
MALKSTIFKVALQIADIDHGYYADHALTLARHPSETDERMMIRLAALALHAHKLQTSATATARWPLVPACPTRTTRMCRCRFHGPEAPVDRSGTTRRQAADQGLRQGRPGRCVLPSTMPPKSGGAASNKLTRPLQVWLPCPPRRAGTGRWPSAACSCRPPSRKARSCWETTSRVDFVYAGAVSHRSSYINYSRFLPLPARHIC